MKTLLEYFLSYFEILYLDPRYSITDSSTTGVVNNDASLRLTGPILSWNLINDKSQILLYVAPTELATQSNWFRVSLIKQYLDGDDEITYLPAADEIKWVGQNSDRVDRLFSDASTIESTCEELGALRNANANKYWSQWRQQHGIT